MHFKFLKYAFTEQNADRRHRYRLIQEKTKSIIDIDKIDILKIVIISSIITYLCLEIEFDRCGYSFQRGLSVIHFFDQLNNVSDMGVNSIGLPFFICKKVSTMAFSSVDTT